MTIKQAILEETKTARRAPEVIEAVVECTQQPKPQVQEVVSEMLLSGELVLTLDRKVRARAA
jgi:hypothetical protein